MMLVITKSDLCAIQNAVHSDTPAVHLQYTYNTLWRSAAPETTHFAALIAFSAPSNLIHHLAP